MNSFLYEDIVAARHQDLLREADKQRVAARVPRPPRGTFRKRLGRHLVRAGNTLLGDPGPAHTR